MNLDITISGGGIKFYYLLGIKRAIEKLEKEKIAFFKRYSATSSGSIILPLIVCKINNSTALHFYKLTQKSRSRNKLDLISIFLNKVLPENAHLLCNNKIFLSITQISGFNIKNKIVSQFNSKDDLINYIKCSCAFPLLANSTFYYKYKNEKYIDGCFTNNTPTFNSKNHLIIKLFFIDYYNFNLFNLEDRTHLKYYQKGFSDLIKYFKGISIDCFQYNDNKLKNIYLYTYYFAKKRILLMILILLFLLKKMN